MRILVKFNGNFLCNLTGNLFACKKHSEVAVKKLSSFVVSQILHLLIKLKH